MAQVKAMELISPKFSERTEMARGSTNESSQMEHVGSPEQVIIIAISSE
jgi:hypothetical protein